MKQKLFEIEFDKHKQEQRERRGAQVGGGDRSDKIRTYNFPQDRMTDHRIGHTVFGIEKLGSGDIFDEFIDLYLEFQNDLK